MSLNVGELYAKLSIESKDFDKELDNAEKGLDKVGKTGTDVFKRIGKMATIATASIAGLGAGVAGLGPSIAGVAGLSASFASAGVGAVAFGAVATSVMSGFFADTEAVTKAQEKLMSADSVKERIEAQKELNSLMAGMSEEQKFAMTELNGFKSFWKDFTKQFEAPIFNAFGTSLNIVKNIFEGLAPTIGNVADVINELLEGMDQDIANGGLAKFFKWMEENGAESLRSFMITAGNVMGGFFELMMAFAPLGASMEEGLIRLTDRFREWSAGLSESSSFQNFIEYAKTNGPVFIGIIGDVLKFLGQIITIVAPLGTVVLGALKMATGAIVAFVGKLQESGDTIGKYKDMVMNNFRTIVNVVKPLIILMGNKIKEIFGMVFDWWKTNGSSFLSNVQIVFNGIWGIIKFIMPTIMAIVNGAFNMIKVIIIGSLNFIKGFFQVFAGIFTGDWSQMVNGIKNVAKSVFDTIGGLITTPIRTAKDTIMSIIDSIKNAFSKMKISIPKPKLPKVNVGSKKMFGVSIPTFSVDWFKTGGIATGPAIAGVGEAGSEAIVPLAGRRMLPFSKSVAEQLADMGGTGSGGNSGNTHVIVKIGEREIIKAIGEPMNRSFGEQRTFTRRANGRGI